MKLQNENQQAKVIVFVMMTGLKLFNILKKIEEDKKRRFIASQNIKIKKNNIIIKSDQSQSPKKIKENIKKN